MSRITRRSFVAAAIGALALAGCDNSLNSTGAQVIDARVETALNFLYSKYPGTRELGDKASGILVMPVVTEAGLGFGASYGRGALLVDNVPVDYYSAAQASFGLQIGAQQYSHALFFMTPEALADFRSSPGWAAGADLEYAFRDQAENITVETTTSLSPVIAVVFAQAGALAGATIEGTKYTRIIP